MAPEWGGVGVKSEILLLRAFGQII
jgi:hypothetical protein